MKFNDVKIGTKLGFGFGVLVLILLASAAMQWSVLGSIKALEEKSARHYKMASEVKDMEIRVQQTGAVLAEAMYADDISGVRLSFSSLKQQALSDIERLSEFMHTKEEKEDAQLFGKHYKMYLKTVEDDFLPLIEKEGRNSVLSGGEELFGRLKNGRKMITKHFSPIIKRMYEASKASKELAERELENSKKLMTILIAVGIVLAVAVAVVIAVSITKRLKLGVSFAEMMARGDLSHPLESAGRDEVGQCLRAIYQVQDTIKLVVESATAIADQTESGRLGFRAAPLQFEGCFRTLLQGSNRIAEVFSNLLAHLPLPLMTMDTDLNILYANGAAEALAKLPSGKMVGSSCADLMRGGDCGTGDCACRRALRSNSVERGETTVTPASGTYDVEYRAIPLSDGAGVVKGVMELVIDHSDIKRSQAKIVEMANESDSVARSLANSSTDLSRQIAEVADGTSNQKNRVAETAVAMEEMNASIMEISNNASNCQAHVDGAREKAQSGSLVVEEVVAAIVKVQEESERLHSSMTELEREVGGIDSILNMITDIADQTNLLALNAAIEAARAGDAGRGFAVVADEVRKLAEKTMSATREVGDAVERIRETSKRNMQVTDNAVAAVDKSTSLSRRSGEVLQEIVELVEEAAHLVNSIATASKEQSSVSEEINSALSEINSVAHDAEGIMQDSAHSVAGLAELAASLENLINEMQSVHQ